MDQTVISHRQITKNWVKKQIMTKEHWAALLVFSLLSVAPIPATVIGIVVIGIVSAFIRIPSILVTMAIVAMISLIFPPIAGILSFIFLLFKIKYIMNHFIPLTIGILLTIYLVVVSYSLPSNIFLFLFSVIGLHVILTYLYRKEYSSSSAISIMCSAPMYILLLILPMIINELNEMDLFSEDSFEDYQHEMYQRYQEADDPGIHSVKGHIRENADGSTSYVRPHIRTNPDGIENNNISSK